MVVCVMQMEGVLSSWEAEALRRERGVRERMELDFKERLERERAKWGQHAEAEVRGAGRQAGTSAGCCIAGGRRGGGRLMHRFCLSVWLCWAAGGDEGGAGETA